MALEPVILEKAGLRIALFSVNLVNAGAFPAGPEKPGTLCLPQHAHPFGPPANAVRGLMVMDLDATGLVTGFRWEQ